MKINLENLLNKLLKEGKIKKQSTDISYLNASLNAAYQNFLAAKYNLRGGYLDTAFKSADDGGQHKTTFMVAGAILGSEFTELIEKIDRCRIKRNTIIYQPLVGISKSEAEGILESAQDYWVKTKKYLKDENRQLELFDF